jgi:hypothetical protein
MSFEKTETAPEARFQSRDAGSLVTQSYMDEVPRRSELEETLEPALSLAEIREIQDDSEKAVHIFKKLEELDSRAELRDAPPDIKKRWAYPDREKREQLEEIQPMLAGVMQNRENAYDFVADVARKRIERGTRNGLDPERSLYPSENPLKPGEQLGRDTFGKTYGWGNDLSAIEDATVKESHTP